MYLEKEVNWLDNMTKQLDTLPEKEDELIDKMINNIQTPKFLPVKYDLK